MSWYRAYRLVKSDTAEGEYVLLIYLNKDSEEFAGEFFSNLKKNVVKLDDKIKKLVKRKFKGIKISSVKLLMGSMIIASIPIAASAISSGANPVYAAPAADVYQQAVINAWGTVTASKLNVRTGPSTAYPVMHHLWKGNRVRIIGENSGWYQIQLSDGRIGWVSKEYMAHITPAAEQALDTYGLVTASSLNVRTGPSTAYSIMHLLWKGNRVKIIGKTGNWYLIRLSDGRTGWVSGSYIVLEGESAQEKINTLIATAKSFLGTPYVWGGSSPADGGFDCSGFTQYVFGKVGYQLNRVTVDQAKQGTAVAYNNMKPGDLVFSAINGDGVINHVGIYLGEGKMIHSPRTGDVVKITDITTSYWTSRFVTARRIIQ